LATEVDTGHDRPAALVVSLACLVAGMLGTASEPAGAQDRSARTRMGRGMTDRLTLTRALESSGMQSAAAERIATEIYDLVQVRDEGTLPAGYRQGVITAITVVLTASILFFRFVVFEPASGPRTPWGVICAFVAGISRRHFYSYPTVRPLAGAATNR